MLSIDWDLRGISGEMGEPVGRDAKWLRPFYLSFEYLEAISSVFSATPTPASAGAADCGHLLNNDQVVAAVEKQMLQMGRRYLRDCRSAHLAADLAKAYIRKAFDPKLRGHPNVACQILRKATPNMLQDYQCVAMVICLSCLWIAAKMESQVPFISLQNILVDYLQSQNLWQPIKSYTLMTEADILHTLDWDIERPSRLSLNVLDQTAVALSSSGHPSVPNISKLLWRFEDFLLQLVALNRKNGTRSCISARAKLLDLHKVPRNRRTEAHTTAAEDLISQIVADSPTCVYPFAALKCVISLLESVGSNYKSRAICSGFGIEMTVDEATVHAKRLSEVYENCLCHLSEECRFGYSGILSDFTASTVAEMCEFETSESTFKFVSVCIQACTKFLESRFRVTGTKSSSPATVEQWQGNFIARSQTPPNQTFRAHIVSPPCENRDSSLLKRSYHCNVPVMRSGGYVTELFNPPPYKRMRYDGFHDYFFPPSPSSTSFSPNDVAIGMSGSISKIDPRRVAPYCSLDTTTSEQFHPQLKSLSYYAPIHSRPTTHMPTHALYTIPQAQQYFVDPSAPAPYVSYPGMGLPQSHQLLFS